MYDRDLLYFRIISCIYWFELLMNFVFEEFVPVLVPYSTSVFLVSDLVIALLGVSVMRGLWTNILAWSFIILSVVSSALINHLPTIIYLNGIREYFPLIFIVPLMWYFMQSYNSKKIREDFDRYLQWFLYIQAFCLVWQFIRYGANDHGGGSLGFGASGTISMLIIVVSFYLISRNWDMDDVLGSIKHNWVNIFLLFPTMLNETKSSFVLIFIYFLMFFKLEIKTIIKVLIALPIILVVMVGLYYTYLVATHQTDKNIASVEYVSAYLDGGEDKEKLVDLTERAAEGELDEDNFLSDVPRFLRYTYMYTVVEDTNGGWLLGGGAGHFKGGTTLSRTPLFVKHEWLMTGTVTPLLQITIQFGVIGLVWYFLWILNAFKIRSNPTIYDFRVKIFAIAIICLDFIYNGMMVVAVPCIIIFYIAAACSFHKDEEIEDEPEPVSSKT